MASSPSSKWTPLIQDAIPTMLKSDQASLTSSPIVVGITEVQPLTNSQNYFQCKVFDRSLSSTTAMIFLSTNDLWIAQKNKSASSATKILVLGYTTSAANYGMTVPFLCIDSFSIVDSTPAINFGRDYVLKQRKFQGGKAIMFLSSCLSFLSYHDLAGQNSTHQQLDRPQITAVNELIVHHSAMSMLHQSSGTDSTTATTETYMTSMMEFQSSQISLQNAMLQQNNIELVAEAPSEVGAAAMRASQVKEQYMRALNMALEHASGAKTEGLTVDLIKQWHEALLGNGLHNNAGIFRNSNLRVGFMLCTSQEQVEEDLKKLLDALKQLESPVLRHVTPDDTEQERGLAVMTYAAAVFFGIIDICPFEDGNGRLSRIALNWALRRGGVPFVVNLFATETQRTDYLTAIKITRRNTYLECHGASDNSCLWKAARHAGGILPIINLIADRIARASTEFQRLIQQKSCLVKEEAEVTAARRFREQAVASTCMICFDDHPNIATLCCGKAAHLNCMATWLTERSSCPQCRAILPTLPLRRESIHSASSSLDDSLDDSYDSPIEYGDRAEADDNDGTSRGSALDWLASFDHGGEAEVFDDSLNSDDSRSVRAVNGRGVNINAVDDSSQEEVYIESEDESVRAVIRRVAQGRCRHQACTNVSETECRNFCCGQCCVRIHGSQCCLWHMTQFAPSDEEEDKEWSVQDSSDEEDHSCDEEDHSCDEEDHSREPDGNFSVGDDIPLLSCSHGTCRNRASIDCLNDCCHHCCAAYGENPCGRHSQHRLQTVPLDMSVNK